MEFTNIYQNMNKQEIYQEIEKILNEINNISQSLSSSREFISENSNKRAQARLAEIESNLQIIAGRIAEINSVI
jgi:methyl-accepting chemotaxis protein|tara:strand:+ start:159 stop:380 length:222 start_codon:yes stop_codon:yes gene_type:complete